MSSTDATLEPLWNEFAKQLLGFIRSRVNDSSAAEDIRQEVFLRLHRSLATGTTIRDLQAWLYRTSRNAIIDHYRRRQSREDLPADSEAIASEPDAGWDALAVSVRRMIDSLPPIYRDAIILADLEGIPQQEVAERLGISLSATKSRIARGREELRHQLEACCQFEFDRRGQVIGCEPRDQSRCPECQ